MSLKCSVLGHSFGETEVERDREEQGSEVVITIREVETCERCGTERTVSENKEVTAIETPDDGVVGGAVDDASRPADPAPDDGGDMPGAAPDESPADDPSADDGAAEIVDAEPSDESGGDGDEEPAVAADAAAGAAGSDGDDVDPDAAPGGDGPDVADAPDPDQGAEIIDAEDDEPVEPVDDELADPSVGDAELEESEPEPEPAEADDAVFIDDGDGEDDGSDRAPGEWPDEGDGDDEDDGEWTPDVGTEEPAEGPEIRKSSGVSVTVPEGQFRCPECGYTTPVESSSLRAGDFCPECHRGSLVNEPAPEDGTRKE